MNKVTVIIKLMNNWLTKKQKRAAIKDVVLVIGSARSGTSWLSEVLNANLEYRLLFEPFSRQEDHNPAWRLVPRDNLYLRPKQMFAHIGLVNQIFSGNITNEWVDRVKPNNYSSERLLVKDIRLNQMIGWVQRNFPDITTILIVRDPRSTAFSQAELGYGGGEAKYREYLRRKRMLGDMFTESQISVLSSASSLFQMNVAKWAIENYVAIRQLNNAQKTTSVYYETLASEPDREYKRLAGFCGHDFSDKTRKMILKRSSTASKKSVTDAASQSFNQRWQQYATKQDIEYVDKLLSVTGLEQLYKAPGTPAHEQPLDVAL